MKIIPKINWKKALTIVLDIALAGYLVVAVTAFNKPDETAKVCTKVVINVADETTNGFIKSDEIKKRLQALKLHPLGKPMRYVDARKIEESLKASPFVQTTECFKTQEGHVNITITQRTPLVRIKAKNGDDYYLDDNNSIMPNSHYTSDLIIATGNISRTFATTYISPLSKAIMDNELWKNQIEQINVLDNLGIELIPRVGEHIIYIGHLPVEKQKEKLGKKVGDYAMKKLETLEKFYKYGLSQAGWNKYKYINLEFDNQIICKRRENVKL
ncbi:MAG: cell division protein FtsQ [Prevotella sp.]|nr:cell division protein FtsQ [Prevotella sp.]